MLGATRHLVSEAMGSTRQEKLNAARNFTLPLVSALGVYLLGNRPLTGVSLGTALAAGHMGLSVATAGEGSLVGESRSFYLGAGIGAGFGVLSFYRMCVTPGSRLIYGLNSGAGLLMGGLGAFGITYRYCSGELHPAEGGEDLRAVVHFLTPLAAVAIQNALKGPWALLGHGAIQWGVGLTAGQIGDEKCKESNLGALLLGTTVAGSACALFELVKADGWIPRAGSVAALLVLVVFPTIASLSLWDAAKKQIEE